MVRTQIHHGSVPRYDGRRNQSTVCALHFVATWECKTMIRSGVGWAASVLAISMMTATMGDAFADPPKKAAPAAAPARPAPAARAAPPPRPAPAAIARPAPVARPAPAMARPAPHVAPRIAAPARPSPRI